MHTSDECYASLRGPAENLTILATASDSQALQKAGRNEPVLMTIQYGKGRVFHTILGHDSDGFEGLSFIETFLRGTEWAATGKVTRPVPANFPDDKKSVTVPFVYKEKVTAPN
jgi:type 1 glutamine amidotransferase